MGESKNISVPQLRFKDQNGKEFPQWETKKLGEVGYTFNGLSGKTKEDFGDGKRYIQYKQIFDSSKIDVLKCGLVHVNDNETQNKVQYGDVFFTVSSETPNEIGMSSVLLDDVKDVYLNSFCFGFRFNDFKKISPEFARFLFRNNLFRDLIKKLAQGSTRYNMSKIQFLNLNISLPTLPEQEKISDFLSGLDKKLELLKKKKELLGQYKKGVMQKIFSQQLRFKDQNGKEFPQWEQKTLGEILIEINERTINSNQYRVLSSTAKGLFYQSDYFNKEVASKDNAGYKILKINQLVFSPQNLWLGNINVNTTYEIGIVSPSYKVFSFNEKAIVSYCKYFLKSSKMMFEYEQCSEQGASIVRRNLNMDLFLNIPILLPKLEEQKKISDFLSGVDKKLDIVDYQIRQTELWKKGIMQKMFV